MFHHYFCINLLNFPHNVEDILHDLQEDADFLDKQTIGEWIRFLCARNSWTEKELQQRIGVPELQFERIKASKKIPSKERKQLFKSLLAE